MKQKTNQTIAKRFLRTKKGKLLKRYAGQDHFNTRDSGKITRKKRRDVAISKVYERTIKTLIQ
ncbi:50S ribosomal protein L35 [Candidatus Uhrbacteria bacterium]|nr:50S ribosomal protein L35 [Candidatus Uhrbacteria bacterium]